ncbi:pitrilysin family protein [Sediminicoccus sp. KRV36]|uniref:M16 family metallopeptidase n=1 Tax=Sediminicoccus sp. KRV36 TaxID=3133721 RepID=UPI00200ED233|nr:pitrilysin family protein [Sediminicoccus rosea]UPY34971.1 insulinase family protein [Sediminicoccus rosea]
MTRRTALKGAAAATLATPALAQSQSPARRVDQPLFGASSWTLANGLRVVLAENRRAPVAAHYLYVSAGAGEDPAGKSGVAHFLEHMMFKGSPHIPSGAFSRTVAREGGQDNAFTSRDVTAYFQIVEASRLPLMMRMEADRLAAPLIPEAETESERNVVLEERRQRTDAVPRGRFREAFDAAMWGPQHWRGRPLIGWEEEIRAITRQDMVDFHTAHYASANCTLIVAGDVREADLRRWAEEFYGPVPARPKPARSRAAPLATAPEPRLITRDPGVREASFLQSFAAPSATWGEAMQSDPLEVMVHVLGGGPGSRLHRALVEAGHAVSANAGYDGDVVGVGSLMVAVTPRPGVSQERIEEIVAATIARLVQEGATEEETRRSIRQQTAGALLALDGLGAAPRMLGGALAIGLPIEAVEQWPARMAAVTQAQVNAAARHVLASPAIATTAWLLPA